jgi:hypothetical protein
MKRYDPVQDPALAYAGYGNMELYEDGDYVLYDDVEALARENAQLKAESRNQAESLDRFQKCFLRIAIAFGIDSPFILIGLSENDDENYAEVLARFIEKQNELDKTKAGVLG